MCVLKYFGVHTEKDNNVVVLWLLSLLLVEIWIIFSLIYLFSYNIFTIEFDILKFSK